MKTVSCARGFVRNTSSHSGSSSMRGPSGVTLTELSVVIFFLLLMATILFTGARGWKRGADRSGCLMNIQAVQKAIRGYGNMQGLDPGDLVSGLEGQVVGSGLFFEALPTCPGGGAYTLLGDQMPDIGTLYLRCSLAGSEQHEPTDFSGW